MINHGSFHPTQVPDLDALLTHVFSDLQQHPDKAEGAGQLLFEMCKGVRNMFHSCTANVSFYPHGVLIICALQFSVIEN